MRVQNAQYSIFQYQSKLWIHGSSRSILYRTCSRCTAEPVGGGKRIGSQFLFYSSEMRVTRRKIGRAGLTNTDAFWRVLKYSPVTSTSSPPSLLVCTGTSFTSTISHTYLHTLKQHPIAEPEHSEIGSIESSWYVRGTRNDSYLPIG